MSKIEWTEKTINTISGCTQISEGCQNCYAKKMHKRLTAMGQEKYKKTFNEIVTHNIEKEFKKVITKNTKTIFINSMSDTFNKDVSAFYIGSLLYEISKYPNIDFQILTKRAERIDNFYYPENVWLGVTVENSKHKDRIEYLKNTNAKIKFLSCEPLLDDLGELDLSGINWVIVGGESGTNARPIKYEWVKNIQKQCKEQNAAFFFKQWGEWCPASQIDYELIKDKFFVYETEDDRGILLNTEINTDFGCYKVGKKYAGSLLDGKHYKEYPDTK